LNNICARINACQTTYSIGKADEERWATQLRMFRVREEELNESLKRMKNDKKKTQWKKNDAELVRSPILD
jgi:hypothetical protein